MRSLSILVAICVFGLAGLTAWLALDYRRPDPAGVARAPRPAAVIALPAAPPQTKPARPVPAASRPPYLDPALVEDGAWGPLPKIGATGRTPAHTYARRFENPGRRPRIAVVVTGLGLRADVTGSALKGLPGPVTLAFSAYAPDLWGWTRRARRAGHETLIELPMGAAAPARVDAGPKALAASLSPAANRDRLHWALGRFGGYVGVIAAPGEAFSTNTAAFAPILDDILGRGLVYVHPRPVSAAPAPPKRDGLVHVDLWLDPLLDADAIDRRMRLAEALARGRGWVVAAVRAYPLTIDAVRRWTTALEDRDLVAAPLTAVASVPRARTSR